MAASWDDEATGGPLPHRDDRLWVHPSEMRAPIAPAPPSPPARPRGGASLGTALVAGAAGAVAMFAAVTALGMTAGPSGGVTARGAGLQLAPSALADLTAAGAAPDRTVAVQLADGTRLAGLVVDPDGHVVVATGLDADAGVRVETSRQRSLAAAVAAGFRDPVSGATVTVLTVEGLRWTDPALPLPDVSTGAELVAATLDGTTAGQAQVLAARWGGPSSCTALLATGAPMAGRLLVDEDGRLGGLAVYPDVDPADRVQEMVPAAVAMALATELLSGDTPACA